VIVPIDVKSAAAFPDVTEAVWLPKRDAPTAEERREANARAEQGKALLKEINPKVAKLALIELSRAYELGAGPRVLYDLGDLAFRMNRFAHAETCFRIFLGRAELTAATREDAQHELESLEARTGWLSLACEVELKEVRVNDADLGRCPFKKRLKVNAGENALVAVTGNGTATQHFTLAAGDSAAFAIRRN
jgi:hypothetical protein